MSRPTKTPNLYLVALVGLLAGAAGAGLFLLIMMLVGVGR